LIVKRCFLPLFALVLLMLAACKSAHHANLTDTYWKLVFVDGATVTTSASMHEAHLVLATADSRAHGFSGCNNFFGHYQADGQALSFSAMGSTRMACPEGMDTEQAFMNALDKTTGAKISGQVMTLYADQRLLARFEAVDPL
jgi:heat shock protein HslJ